MVNWFIRKGDYLSLNFDKTEGSELHDRRCRPTRQKPQLFTVGESMIAADSIVCSCRPRREGR